MPIHFAEIIKESPMTREMAFECLLVSEDPAVFCTMHRVLKDFSITTNLCMNTSQARQLLNEGGPDLIVMDWDSEAPSEFVRDLHNTSAPQKPTIVAVAGQDQPVPEGAIVLRKPLTFESGTESMRAVYTRMVRDFRKHVRYAVMEAVLATDQSQRSLRLTVTNIGDGGVGVTTNEKLGIGDVLSFSMPLPDTGREILVQARVLWTREYGAAGCEFVRIPHADLQVMLDWLKSRCRIKQPLIDLNPRF